MEYSTETSNIKITGVPLLPPLITNDITTEIQYYKQLAAAVEEKLKVLEKAKDAIEKSRNIANKDGFDTKGQKLLSDATVSTVSTEYHNNTIDLFESETGNILQSMTLKSEVDFSTNEKVKNLIDIDIPETQTTEGLIDQVINCSNPKEKPLQPIEKSLLDEDRSCLNDSLLGDSVTSDTVTVSTDLNHYLNTSASLKTDTAETTPENWKPQVPKTLDIVPITVDQSKPPDKSNLVDEETPKLIRRGSYVLETPSPMLLAHMQNELTNTEYTPTSSNQSLKRKEWNISQIKTDWESQSNFKEPLSRVNSSNKLRKSSRTNIPTQRISKSVSNSKTGSPLEVYQPAKSVDCIQAMFIKECYSPKAANSRNSNYSQKFSSPVNGTNGIKDNSSKKFNKNTSVLNLANKLSGSLGSLSSSSPKPIRRVEKKNNNNDTNLNKSFNRDSVKSNESTALSKKAKPVITSEKIVTVFKEIQDTHKKQMVELITKQQKEQLLMQENFKKQQILLLAQIRKAFPEISISALTEAITGKNVEHSTALSSRISNEKSDSTPNESDKPQVNGITSHVKDQDRDKLPVDYNHPSKELSSTSCHLTIQPTTPTVAPYCQNTCQASQTFDDSSSILISQAQLSNIRIIDDIPVGIPIRRHSSVSRQLFPLDSKTMHIPILDNSMYTEKHIIAATIINAYARGFLVRRLMKTEKIIALKNTYKEALHCMLRLHVDAPLNLPELNFHQRLQLQCDAASMNIVDLFSQTPAKRMEIIAHDREIKKVRSDRPSSARSYSFATQRTLARKKLKEMGICPSLQSSMMSKSCPARTRCQTWTSNSKEKKITASLINQGIKRSTSAGAVRKPWR